METENPPKLYVSSYTNYIRYANPQEVAPIRTSCGRPRNSLAGAEYLEALAPTDGLRWIADREDFTAAYVEKLEAVGVAGLKAQFAALADEAGVTGLALLCFENIEQPGVWCHREVFAEWWEAQTGERVEELRSPQAALI